MMHDMLIIAIPVRIYLIVFILSFQFIVIVLIDP